MSKLLPYRTKSEQKRFYNSKEWQRVRRQRLKIDNYECQPCKREGLVTVDSVRGEGERKEIVLNVHHKEEIETHPELALEINNLETVCVYHHNKEHGRFQKMKHKQYHEEKW